jgi:signal transduction histidine kinase
MKYIESANSLAQKAGDTLDIIRTEKLLGFAYMDAGEYVTAIDLLKSSLRMARIKREDVQTKSILNSIGISFGEMKLYDSALAYHLYSLELREKMRDKRAIYVSLNNIGVIYLELNNLTEALRYFLAAMEIANQNGFPPGIELNINIGNCYNKKGDFEKAIIYLQKGIANCGKDCNPVFMTKSYASLAQAYFSLDEFTQAEVFANKSLEVASSIQENASLGLMQFLLAKIDIAKGNNQRAIELLGGILSKFPNDNDLLIDTYWSFYQLYGKLGNDKTSRLYLERYTTLKDSVSQHQLASTLAKIQAQYEERANLKTIREQAEILQLKEEVIQRQRQQTIFITIIACLGIALTYLLFRFSRELQRKRTDLSIKNKQLYEVQDALRKVNRDLDQLVAERTKDLADINQSLASTNEELDYFIYKTSHDIRGPLASLLGLAHLGKLEVTEPVASNYLHQIDGTASKLNAVLSKMAKINQISRGDLKPVLVNLEGLIAGIVARQTAHLPPGKVEISTTVDAEVHLVSDVALMETCLENLISNAIKYRSDSVRIQPFVKIQVEQKMHVVRVRVIDNGIGIPDMPQEQLFRMFVRASERSETGGIGLYLAKLSATRIFGKLSYSKNEVGHTVFTLLLHPNLEQRLAQVQQLRDEKARQEALIRARVQSLSDEVL